MKKGIFLIVAMVMLACAAPKQENFGEFVERKRIENFTSQETFGEFVERKRIENFQNINL